MRLDIDGVTAERADAQSRLSLAPAELSQLPLALAELPLGDIAPAAWTPAFPLLVRRGGYAFGGR
ncbi:hypothetical protein [Streptomyces pseudovenezuelae]|uniref:Uncharacterized protein n=1 Tax=Streptomyces pseudovenezuelae TaxID=67350 RepID=A0ABT6LS22_9ACTN|nr:hypothetical protein [Streptomyces pseudovenezuelae]